MHHQRSEIDRRSVRVRLTEKGRDVRDIVARLFERHAEGLNALDLFDDGGLCQVNGALVRLERFWTEQIRYIY